MHFGGETQPLDADRRLADGEPLFGFSSRTPFSNWYIGVPKYALAVARQKGTLMSYGLDIWLPWKLLGTWRPRKVLNVQWAERDESFVELVSFRRGPWEEEVLALR